MSLKLTSFTNKLIDNNYQKIIKELGDFFEINWIKNQPKIIVVDDRKTFDNLLNHKTEKWLVGWAHNQTIYVLDGSKFKSQADREYSDEKYLALIKHELSHLFFNILNSGYRPVWLTEGVAGYISGQNKLRKKIPIKFKNFLDFFDKATNHQDTVYEESGFIVEFLVKEFGKKKILDLIKSGAISDTKNKFKESFKKIYGFDLNYANLNKLYQSKS